MAEVRAFNSAKKFAEEVLHPIIKNHSDAKIVTRLGAISIAEANQLSPNQRVVARFNSTKERTILQQTLINEIEATILINNVKVEIKLLKEIKKNLDLIEENFEDKKDEILSIETIRGIKTPVLTRKFTEINRYLDKTYVQVQKIMTKNRLLFTSDNDDWMQEAELKEKIKSDNLKS